MAKITLIMDFISGLLLAYDFFPKSGWLLEFHNKLRKHLEKVDTNDPTKKGTIIFNLIVGVFIFLMILCWAYYKSKNAPDAHILAEVVSYFLGSAVAFVIIMVLTKIIKKQLLIFICGLILALVTFILIGQLHPSNNVVAGLIAVTLMVMLLPFAAMTATYTKRALLAHPEKEYYFFAFLGLVLFIVSNLIQINVDP